MRSAVNTWNRKLHIYSGLYLLFFVWLFCLSGVILNHPKWRFSEFWPEREQTSTERKIAQPAGGEDLTTARNLMAQLGIKGEVSGGVTHPASGGLGFRVVRPGDIYDIKADYRRGVADVSHIHVNGWGALNMLHSFTGVRRTDSTLRRNWWATTMWSGLMDALSAALAFMVVSGIFVWYGRHERRFGGFLALTLGIIVLVIFIAG